MDDHDAIVIREARLDDVGFIKSCIHGLAVYEKAEEMDLSTEDMLRKNIFEDQYAHVLIGEIDGIRAGFALWFNNFSTWLAKPGIHLEDLYVKPEYRGCGLGRRLLTRLAEIAVENDWGRLEWWCLKWNKPSLEFYESLGASRLDEWVPLRIDGEQLKIMGKR